LGIDRPGVSDRMRLVEETWDSIAAEDEAPELPRSHRDELDRRLAAYRSDPEAGSSWDEVKARLKGRPGDGL